MIIEYQLKIKLTNHSMVAFLYYEKLEHIKKTDLLRTCMYYFTVAQN